MRNPDRPSSGDRGRVRRGRPLALAGLALGVVIVAVAATLWLAGRGAPGPTGTTGPSDVAAASGTLRPSLTPSPTPTPTPAPVFLPTPAPTLPPVAATTDGVLLPASQAALATRHVIAVMIDDQALARPQSGLASANIVYQAPAEGGIPRYMALFQTATPPAIGPVRSTRLYFVDWAAEWRAMYVHVGGAPNALAFLHQQNGKLVYDADEFRYGGRAGFLWRVTTRSAPHNVYSSGAKLEALARRLGATARQQTTPWTFVDDVPFPERPRGGSIVIPYPENRISYAYDPRTNTYRRSVTGQKVQKDAGDGQPIAPANVIVLQMTVGRLANAPGQTNNIKKGRLDIDDVGSGSALVFSQGTLVRAHWSKANVSAPTLVTYASGSRKGQPVALARGQIFIQVVPAGTAVTWSLASPPAPGAERS